jgi:16S rRNA processing protein RimM
MDDSSDNLITVGRISGTHGVRGQVRLHSYSGNLESLQAAHDVLLRFPSGISRQIKLARVILHSGKILLALEGIDAIDQAQEFVGCELILQWEQLPKPDEDEYYWRDLLGLSVITSDGQLLGNISDIMETGANDVYLVKNDATRREYLIPAISNVIDKIDLQTGTMTITPLEGLLDL